MRGRLHRKRSAGASIPTFVFVGQNGIKDVYSGGSIVAFIRFKGVESTRFRALIPNSAAYFAYHYKQAKNEIGQRNLLQLYEP
jgi:hypothetical protein